MAIAFSIVRFAVFPLVLLFAGIVWGSEETRLIESINTYRSQPQRCADEVGEALPPLTIDPRLSLPIAGDGDLEQTLSGTAYPLVNAQAIRLSGPRDASAALVALQESFCRVLLNPQFVDIGVSREGRDWRIVLGRPLLDGDMGSWKAEGQKLLARINVARSLARHCGARFFAAAPPLTWNSELGAAAEAHSRAMARGNFFSHRDGDGLTPGDRAELAGYEGGSIGENIAAALAGVSQVVDGWLASPGHCANLMSPVFRELGAAYAVDPKSDAGIYWTALFGAP